MARLQSKPAVKAARAAKPCQLDRVTRYKPDGDKIMRLHAQTATIENGFVHLTETARWLADYLHDLTMFPAARYDDQVDSTVNRHGIRTPFSG
jgi:predicted phage terminase large subunit-like protein